MNILIALCAKYLFLVSILVAGIYFTRIRAEEKKRLAILALITFPLAFIVAKILSYFVSDPRPFVVLHVQPLIAHAADNGFPSDHTLLTMTIAAVIFVSNKKWGLILGVTALLIGSSRILALVHHPLDIFGSIVIAIVTTWVGVLAKHWWDGRKS